MLHWEKQVLSNPDEQNYYSSNPDDYDDDEQNSDEQNYLSSNPDECDESNQDEEEVMYWSLFLPSIFHLQNYACIISSYLTIYNNCKLFIEIYLAE